MSHLKNFALCLEDLDARSDRDRYLQCVALPGRQPGLRVDGGGAVIWKSEAGAAAELWVSSDERLILFRPLGGATVVVRRGGRSLEAPFEKPVVLLDQDLVEVGGRRFRVHLHGETSADVAPTMLRPRERTTGSLTRIAAALAAGAVVGAAACDRQSAEPTRDPVEVREVPPAPVMPPIEADAGQAGDADRPSTPASTDAAAAPTKAASADSAPTPIKTDSGPPQPQKAVKAPPGDDGSRIEVRMSPPGAPARPRNSED